MKKINVTAHFRIKNGKLDEFKKLIPEFISTTREKDPGTLQYEFYLNEEKSECVVIESYADSNSLLAHAGNVGELLNKTGDLADITLTAYGDPNEELQKVMNDMGVVHYPFYAGL